MDWQHIWPQLAPWIVIGAVLAFRFRNISRPRPFRADRLWIVPALYTVVVAGLLVWHPARGEGFVWNPPSILGWVIFVVALGAGSLLGWQRGRLTHLERDPQTGAVMMRQSAAGLLLILGVILLRKFAAAAFGGVDANAADPASAARVILVSDALLGFAYGVLTVQRIEMGLRARRLPGVEQSFN
jgi:hypothetical protein